MHEPIAYTYDADTHCPACARARFGDALDDGTACDSEGNELGAVAPWEEWYDVDEGSQTLTCGTCGATLDEYEPEETDEPARCDHPDGFPIYRDATGHLCYSWDVWNTRECALCGRVKYEDEVAR